MTTTTRRNTHTNTNRNVLVDQELYSVLLEDTGVYFVPAFIRTLASEPGFNRSFTVIIIINVIIAYKQCTRIQRSVVTLECI